MQAYYPVAVVTLLAALVYFVMAARAAATHSKVGILAPTMTGDVLPGMVAAVNEHLAPLVTGKDALKRAELAQVCAHALHHNGGPKCAVDGAIADLVGRHLNVPLSDLYGGALREEITAMYLLGNPRIEDDIAETHKKIKEGYKFFKLKVGIKNPFDEADAAVRDETGDQLREALVDLLEGATSRLLVEVDQAEAAGCEHLDAVGELP